MIIHFDPEMSSVVAYLDPGTGSLIIQVVIASVLGGLFTVKVYWGRIKAFFRRDKDS